MNQSSSQNSLSMDSAIWRGQHLRVGFACRPEFHYSGGLRLGGNPALLTAIWHLSRLVRCAIEKRPSVRFKGQVQYVYNACAVIRVVSFRSSMKSGIITKGTAIWYPLPFPISCSSVMTNSITVMASMSSLWKTASSGLSRCWGQQASCKRAIWAKTTFPMRMMTDYLVKTPHLLPVQSQISGRLFVQRVASSRVHPSSRRTKETILDISVSTVDMMQDRRD